jgi:hydroxymethylpyrimidine/phosphomethylpyrimidine kinase
LPRRFFVVVLMARAFYSGALSSRAMRGLPVVLTIAGSDSSGGAGVQADLKAIAACGGHGACAITALTAQNTRGVTHIEVVGPAMIRAQIDAVFDDLDVAAVKTGMLADAASVVAVAEALEARRPRHVVVDPVMVASSGAVLMDPAAVDAVRSRLAPLATVLLPNADEVRMLAGRAVDSPTAARRAFGEMLHEGASVLLKGGHLPGPRAVDLLVTPDQHYRYDAARQDTPHTHGTGCTLAAALATYLARGYALVAAVAAARRFIIEAIAAGYPIGHGPGPTNPLFFLRGGGWEDVAPRAPGAADHIP